MSQPGFFFYPGDWYKDTRVLTLACRGAWIDLLGELNEHAGAVSWLMSDYARFWGCTEEVAGEIVRELSRLNTADVTTDSHGIVTVMSRRMKRELIVRENTKLRKRAERDRKHVTRKSQDDVTPLSASSSSPSLNPSPSPSPSPEEKILSSKVSVSDFTDAWNKLLGEHLPKNHSLNQTLLLKDYLRPQQLI